MTLTLILGLISASLMAPPAPGVLMLQSEAVKPYEGIWNATCAVESDYNPFAINLNDPNGGSWGVAQIGQQKLDEYNNAYGTKYIITDCFDVEVSKKVFMWHCMKYYDAETACRVWNGGYNGMNMESTFDYYELIKTHL